jgi:hypothetical protein
VQASAVAEVAAVPEVAAPTGEANAAEAVRMNARTRRFLKGIERLLREGGLGGREANSGRRCLRPVGAPALTATRRGLVL